MLAFVEWGLYTLIILSTCHDSLFAAEQRSEAQRSSGSNGVAVVAVMPNDPYFGSSQVRESGSTFFLFTFHHPRARVGEGEELPLLGLISPVFVSRQNGFFCATSVIGGRGSLSL